MERSKKIIVVAGATGHQGGAAARHLIADGWQVRALTRHPDQPAARALAGMGAEIVRADLLDRASLDAALTGAYGCFSVEAPGEAGPEGEFTEGRNLADAAQAAGVEQFVYDSVQGAGAASPMPFVAPKIWLEAYIRDLGLPHTIWRPSTFMENLLRQREDIVAGVLRGPDSPDTIRQMIAVDDIGRFVALAFARREEWLGKATVIAGERLRAADVADVLGRVLGHEVRYEQIPPAQGMPVPPKQPAEPADIVGLRAIMPDLKTLEQWARTVRWETEAAGSRR